MSAYVAPLLWIKGRVRNVVERNEEAIPAVEPAPARFDDYGNLVSPEKPGREAVPARTLYDVLIDTHRDGCLVPVGMVEVVITERSQQVTDGYLPSIGDEVEWPVRGYQKWYGAQGKRRSTNGYSLAGDVYAADQKSIGKRTAQPVPVAS